MKNILDFDKYGSTDGVNMQEAVFLTKEQCRDLLDDLIETFSSMLDLFSEINRTQKQNDVACKRDIIKAHYLKLQTLFPLANTGWTKFAQEQKLLTRLTGGQKKYDMQDIYRLSRDIFRQSFSFARESVDLKTLYFFYVLKKEPERWKEIYRLAQEDPDESRRISLVDIFLKIESAELQQKIAGEESDFIIKHFSEFLEKSGSSRQGVLWIHCFSWLRDYLSLLFVSKYRRLWEEKLSTREIWPIVSRNKKVFDRYWTELDEDEKGEFIHAVASLYENNGHDFNSSVYDQAMRFFENFSPEEKERLAEYFRITYTSLSRFNRHLWWIPRHKRLDYFKNHTPMNNALCYSLFQYSSKFPDAEESLMNLIGTENELLNKEEIAEYMQYLINEHGRDAVYLNEAIERYEKWLADKKSSLEVEA